MVQTR